MFQIISFLIFFLAVILYIGQKIRRNLQYWEKKGVKYVKPWPLVGNMLPTVLKSSDIAHLYQKLYQEFPEDRYCGIFQFTTPKLLIRDPELIKNLTIKNFENFVDHSTYISEEAEPLWGKNLFASRGERWRDLRQTMSAAFTGSKMRAMFVLMDECAKELTSYVVNQNKDLIDVEMKDFFVRYTNDVIASTAFGVKCNSLKDKDNEFIQVGHELTDLTGIKRFTFILLGNYPNLCKWLNLKMITKRVDTFFRSIIDKTIALREESNIVRPDLIHLLMLARKGKLTFEEYTNLPEAGFAAPQESKTNKTDNPCTFLTNEDITAQALVFFLGGMDTTSNLIGFLAYELAVNPDVQMKLRQEIRDVWKKTQGKLTYESVSGMKYLDMVASESLRKYPQGIFLDRLCTKDYVIEPDKKDESPVKLKAGDSIIISAYGIHMDEKYFPEPERFCPERFSDDNKDNIIPGTYLPFGIGPRNCIGSRFALLTTKVLFVNLLSQFEIVPVKETEVPLKFDKNNAFLIPENGFPLGLKKANDII